MNTLDMDYSFEPRDPSRRLKGLVIVIALHVLIGYLLMSGLARKGLNIIKKPLEAVVIQEITIPPPPPPPPPKKIDKVPELRRVDAPPPPPLTPTPFVPQPEVPPPKGTAIESAVAPPPAPIEIPPPPPVPPAPVGKAVGSTKLVEACADAPDRKMVAEVYQLNDKATSTKDMYRQGRKPVGTVCLTNLVIAPRNMGLGIPGMDFSEWYGLDIRFTVNVPQDGPRSLMLLVDDGGTLTVDDVEVLNADGKHGADAVWNTVEMTKGLHNFRVRYFQGPGDGALMLLWSNKEKPETKDYQPIPSRLLGRPPVAASPPG